MRPRSIVRAAGVIADTVIGLVGAIGRAVLEQLMAPGAYASAPSSETGPCPDVRAGASRPTGTARTGTLGISIVTPTVSERFQCCLSGVRTVLVMTLMRLGVMRGLRRICQGFGRAMSRSTGARAADRARFAVCSVGVRSLPGGRRLAVVTRSPAPM